MFDWMVTNVSLPLWQIVGASYLFLAIGGGSVYIYLVHIKDDNKAVELVKRENAPKAWRQVIFILVGIPGLVSAFFVGWAVLAALSKAPEDYMVGEIPLPFSIFLALAVIVVPIVWFITHKRSS
jgi:hypothetical protein